MGLASSHQALEEELHTAPGLIDRALFHQAISDVTKGARRTRRGKGLNDGTLHLYGPPEVII
jgi:hypothetical protein